MKWLCILLLAANALFVGWRVNERLYGSTPNADEESTVPPLPADAPALTLLSESSEAPMPLDGATAEPPAPGTATDAGPSTDADADANPALVAAATAADGEPKVAAAELSAPSPAAAPTPVVESTAAPTATDTTAAAPVPAESPQGQVAELAGPNPPAAPDTAASPPAGATAATTPPAAGAEGEQSAPPASPATATVEPNDAQAAADEPVAAEAPAKPVLLCATIGPFATRDAQRAAERRLTARVERIDGRSQVAREAKMFTVFLEATGTEAEAEKRLDDLKSKGITDYLLIRRGEMRNAIQVGTFRSQESVTKRLAELERSGYKAVVVPKSEAGAEKFWLDVVYDKEKQTLRSLKSLAGGVRAIRADCPR